jgi:hypothetical protein
MSTRYDNDTILKTQQDKPYYKSRAYPNIPLSSSDIYIITTIGDRLDYLAHTYYNDSEMWWIISAANNNATKGSMFPIPGTQLRIPTNLSAVLKQFDQFNKAR